MSGLKEYFLKKWAPDYDELRESSKSFDRFKKFFPRFLDPKITENRLDKTMTTDGEVKEICVMFTDLRGFTRYSEKADLRSTNSLLNNFYDIVIYHTQQNTGVIDKFIGDGTMSIFGMFDPAAAAMAAAAVSAARGIMQDFTDMTSQSHEPNLALGIGIAQGPALVGNFGNGELVTFTAVGNTVNLAARIQGLADANNILITRDVAKYLPSETCANKGRFEFKNVTKKVEIFEVV